MIPKILLLVEQIRPRTAQVDNLRTPIPVLLQSGTFETIESVRDSLFPHLHEPLFPQAREGKGKAYLSTAYNAFILIVAKGTFVADTDERCRTHVAIAHRAFAVTFITETTDCYAGLLAAHY